MLRKFASRTVAAAAATGIAVLGAVGITAPAQAAIPYVGKITVCNHGAFVLYEDARDRLGQLYQSKDLYAGQCVSFYNGQVGSSTLYLSARDGSNTSGTFHTTWGRDQCFSASGLAGDAHYQAAC